MNNTAENILVPSVPTFGLHVLDGKAFLFQDSTPNGFSFSGKAQDSGFNSQAISGRCPHGMNLYLRSRSVPKKLMKTFEKIQHDPLVKAMLPLPAKCKGGEMCYQLDASTLPMSTLWLTTLQKLSSPLYTQVSSIDKINENHFVGCLKQTNLYPLVITNVDVNRHLHKMNDLIAEADKHSRLVIFVCENGLAPNLPEIKTQITSLVTLNELVLLPLEHIGVRVLDKYVGEINAA